MNNFTPHLLIALLCCCLSFCTPSVAFASSENWVEVTRFTGYGSLHGDSSPFRIKHVEWRIKWEFTTATDWWFNDFSFYVNPHNGGKVIASISYPNEKNGTLYITHYTGEFHLFFISSMAKDWTVIVEQNTDSPIQTENWVQVSTLTGQGGSSTTDAFTVEHNDWRIFWEVELDDEIQWPILQAYIFPQTGMNGSEPYIGSIERLVHEQTSGILRIYNQSGSFYIDISASVQNYTIIVEQNIDSIPEFPSWIIIPLFLVATISIVVFSRKLTKTR